MMNFSKLLKLNKWQVVLCLELSVIFLNGYLCEPMRILLFPPLLFLLTCSTDTTQTSASKEKLKVLIMTGRNNHEWAKTTPILERMYHESGRFEVDITAQPDTLVYENFIAFDAVVSNYSAWPDHEYRWPENTEAGLMRYIEEGGGFVLFHAASATFYAWEEYQEMIGSTWGDNTRHGRVASHKIEITDRSHPVTEGMKDFWITDELWVQSGTRPDIKILAYSVSDPSNKGRDIAEPVVIWRTKGRGRIFHNILGHNERAVRNTGWQTLMLRGTEWAATGKVTMPLPPELALKPDEKKANFSWQKTDTTFALTKDNEVIWQYNYNTHEGKPFFHPVRLGKATLTVLSPDDHPWHLGIWHSWKFINGVNYWEYERGDGIAPWQYKGVTEIREIKIEPTKDNSCTIRLDIAYHEKGGPDLMHEKRTIFVSRPAKDGSYFIDYNFAYTAIADAVELNRTPLPGEQHGKAWGGYAGLSVRFGQDLWQPSFLNPDGSREKKHGKSMPWKYYGFRALTGEKVGIAIFDYPENLNYPTPWFVEDREDQPFYYFGPAVIYYGPHTLYKGDNLRLRYRLKLIPGEVAVRDLDTDMRKFTNKNN